MLLVTDSVVQGTIVWESLDFTQATEPELFKLSKGVVMEFCKLLIYVPLDVSEGVVFWVL
jgi:hypothetical protein